MEFLFEIFVFFYGKKFKKVIQNEHSHKVALKPARHNLAWCGRREVFKRSYVLTTKEEE